MLVREQPATDLTIATRILARAGALASGGRITLRLHDVLYVCGRGVSLATMTPYDVAVVLLSDGTTLRGDPPDDVAEYVDAHRRRPEKASAARLPDGSLVAAGTLRGCVVAVLRHARGEEDAQDDTTIERVWTELVAQARMSGALIGAFPTENGAG